MPENPDAFEIPAWVDDRLVPVDKLEVHRRGLRHPAVSVFVIWQGETLLQQRAAAKYHTPGCGPTAAAPTRSGARRPRNARVGGWARSWDCTTFRCNRRARSNTAPMSGLA